MAGLRVTQGNAAGTEIPVAGEFLIGRSAEGHGKLGDDPEISRQHARVSEQGGQLAVEDLGSTNGTWVNGARIAGRQVLGPGDELRVGKTTMVVEGGERTVAGAPVPPAAPAPPAPGPAQPPPTQQLPPTQQMPPAGPPPPQYAPPYAAAPADTGPGNGKAVAALVLGILAILLCWAGIGLILAIAAIVLGVGGKRAVDRGRTRKNRGMAQAGFILGIIGIPLTLIVTGLVGYGIYFALTETENVNDALLAYVEALEDRDADAICDQLTDDAQDEVVERASGGGVLPEDCEQAAQAVGGFLPSVDEEGRETLEDGDASVSFEGLDKATIEQDPGSGEWEFEKDGGDWKISGLPES